MEIKDVGSSIKESTITIRPSAEEPSAAAPARDMGPVATEVSRILDELGAQGITVEKSDDGTLTVIDGRKSLIPDDAREILSTPASDHDPSLVTLRQVELLVRDPEALSELSDREIVGFAALEAMNAIGMIKIPGTMRFVARLIVLRQAKERKRVGEFISALTGGKINIDLLNTLIHRTPSAGAADDPATPPKKTMWQRITRRGPA